MDICNGRTESYATVCGPKTEWPLFGALPQAQAEPRNTRSIRANRLVVPRIREEATYSLAGVPRRVNLGSPLACRICDWPDRNVLNPELELSKSASTQASLKVARSLRILQILFQVLNLRGDAAAPIAPAPAILM